MNRKTGYFQASYLNQEEASTRSFMQPELGASSSGDQSVSLPMLNSWCIERLS